MRKQWAVTLGILGTILVAAGVYCGRRMTHDVRAAKIPKLSASTGMQPAPLSRPPASTKVPGGSENSPATPAAPAPLRSGEVLEFVADVAKLTNVANLRLTIVEQRNFFGREAWHLQALAHTENPLRMVFELDDQFDSYSELNSFSTLQYEMHLNERGEKIDSIQRMVSNGSQPVPKDVSETRVLPGTRDPLGLMEYFRTLNWEKTPEVRGPVYDGHKLYDVRASYQGKASNLAVPAGSFTTSKIEIRVFEAGVELKDAHFVLYIAENPTRTPVLLEAVMPFATARVALAKYR